MNRRSFLATIVVAPMAPVLVSAISVAKTPCRATTWTVPCGTVQVIIASALMQIGVLLHHEEPTAAMVAHAHDCLTGILSDHAFDVPTNGGHALVTTMLTALLANRLLPFYDAGAALRESSV